MTKPRFTGQELICAGEMRQQKADDISAVLTGMRSDALKLDFDTTGPTLGIKVDIVGDTAPYSDEDVRYFLGELGVKTILPLALPAEAEPGN